MEYSSGLAKHSLMVPSHRTKYPSMDKLIACALECSDSCAVLPWPLSTAINYILYIVTCLGKTLSKQKERLCHAPSVLSFYPCTVCDLSAQFDIHWPLSQSHRT